MLRTLDRDTRAHGDPKLDHGDLDADSGYLMENGYFTESRYIAENGYIAKSGYIAESGYITVDHGLLRYG